MATVQEIMLDSLVKAQRAAEQIMNNTERAHAFSELATACAAAIRANNTASAVVEEKVEDAPKTSAPKRRTRKAAAEPAKEEVVPEQEAVQPVSEPEQPKEEIIPDPEPVQEEAQEAVPASTLVQESAKEVITPPSVSESAPVQETTDSAATTPMPDSAPEEPVYEQWTPQAMQALEPYINKLQGFINAYGNEAVRALINNATHGRVTEPNQISPMEIKLIVQLGEKCIQEAQQQE